MMTFNNLEKYGRFGNQLFHIASTIGIAIRNGYAFSFPEWKGDKHFKKTLPKTCYTSLGSLPEYKVKNKNGGLLMEYKQFAPPDNVSLLGHFFSEKYFMNCEKTIRHYFEMKPIPDLPIIEKNSICIHVRVGDFGTKQFPRLPIEYYYRAMTALTEVDYIWPCKFYVFSDDIGEAKKTLYPEIVVFGSNLTIEYIETNDYIKDFYLMRQCKHFIIANSTFSWWAAWLGKDPNKIVVAPKNMETAMYKDSMYPNKWIVL